MTVHQARRVLLVPREAASAPVIILWMTDPSALARLRRSVLAKTLTPLLESALGPSGHLQEHLIKLAVADKTTMLHLLAGIESNQHRMCQIARLRPL
jgi:hypothetical protein